jgi:hypothetical protein
MPALGARSPCACVHRGHPRPGHMRVWLLMGARAGLGRAVAWPRPSHLGQLPLRITAARPVASRSLPAIAAPPLWQHRCHCFPLPLWHCAATLLVLVTTQSLPHRPLACGVAPSFSPRYRAHVRATVFSPFMVLQPSSRMHTLH